MFDIRVPFPIMADAYTISSNVFASEECKKFSVYNLINRKSPASAWPVEFCRLITEKSHVAA